MQKIYAFIGAAALGALVLGSLVAVRFAGTSPDEFAECRSDTVVGGQIGGPFTLVDGQGREVTDQQVLAKPSLVYFGYTSCADVCPLDNTRNAAVADILAEKGYDVTPVFISVDPARDTPQIMQDYASNMSPRMIGLTGSEAQVKAAAQAYKVFYNIPNPQDEYYSVDHTTFTYLMLPGQGFMDLFDRDTTEEEISRRVACYLDKAKS